MKKIAMRSNIRNLNVSLWQQMDIIYTRSIWGSNNGALSLLIENYLTDLILFLQRQNENEIKGLGILSSPKYRQVLFSKSLNVSFFD